MTTCRHNVNADVCRAIDTWYQTPANIVSCLQYSISLSSHIIHESRGLRPGKGEKKKYGRAVSDATRDDRRVTCEVDSWRQ